MTQITDLAAEVTQIDPWREAAHALGLALLSLSQALTHSRDDEILEHLDVVGIDDTGIDRHRLEMAGSGDDRLHHPAPSRPLDGLGCQRFLGRGHLGLHLLHLLHHLVHLLLVGHGAPRRAGVRWRAAGGAARRPLDR